MLLYLLQKEGIGLGKEAKTNAMRMLDKKKIAYEALTYEVDTFIDGMHCAELTGCTGGCFLQDAGHAGKKQTILCVCNSDCV